MVRGILGEGEVSSLDMDLSVPVLETDVLSDVLIESIIDILPGQLLEKGPGKVEMISQSKSGNRLLECVSSLITMSKTICL